MIALEIFWAKTILVSTILTTLDVFDFIRRFIEIRSLEYNVYGLEIKSLSNHGLQHTYDRFFVCLLHCPIEKLWINLGCNYLP